MFYSAYTSNQRIHSSNKSGTDTYHCWELVSLPNGSRSFVKGPDKPLYQRIQSFSDETDIKTIISRCMARDGDLSALNADKSRSIDLRFFPSTVKDYQAFVSSVRSAFENLPNPLKVEFSSFEEFSKNPDMLTTLFDKMALELKNKPLESEEK